MNIDVRGILSLAWLMATFGDCLAQPTERPLPRPDTLVFHMASVKLPPGRIRLANGVTVDRKDWPTLILAELDRPGARRGTCTGALVGPNTVLLAAHCVDTEQGARPSQLWVDSRRLNMACDMHPKYVERKFQRGSAPRGSEDFALCLLDDKGKPPASFSTLNFEVIDAKTLLNASDPVLMTGYGCSAIKIADNGEPDWISETGTLRIGNEKIDSPPGRWPSDPAYVTIRSMDGREPALCPGDSGGPLFTGVTAAKPNGERRIRGVNSVLCTSRRNEATMCASEYGPGRWDIVSAISATGFPEFGHWVDKWIEDNKAQAPIVCGVNRAAGRSPCRD